ncbi:lactococcin 972 family bacteriocin [Streptomyces erythrochromogenes]|uniref:lactococcin 972 family bacteriocin n=1 Tax=Streptomyces erythrochromogenes TaxID=285574 RepID=UPI0003048C98
MQFNKLKVAAAAAVIVMGAAVPAAATQSDVSGGTWNYGTSGNNVYSNYFHVKNCHGSSAQGSYLAQSGNVDAGKTSYASASKAWSGNKSYYRSNCN